MEGAGPSDSPGLRTLGTLEDILVAHYPGKLGKVLVVNASGVQSEDLSCDFVSMPLPGAVSPVVCLQTGPGGPG